MSIDLHSAQSTKTLPRIGLVEELLLLALEDSGGEFDSVPEIYLNCGIAGAALMDLALRDRIDSDLDGVFAVSATPTGDAALDRVLSEIATEPKRLTAQEWISRLCKQAPALRKAALATLCARGVLRESDHKFLWVLKERRYPIVEGQERPEAKRRILALLYNDDLPSPEDVALTALASASFVFERILSANELKRVAPRIAQIARMDLIGGEILRTAHRVNLETRAAERRTVIAGLAGNVMEWYDFGVYGFFAAAIGSQFFPSDDPSTSLLASFGVFAVGFIARPLGGLLFGHIGDRLGRRAAVVSSVVLMIIPTLFMALLPTYAQIGVAAPIFLVLLRLAQGLAVGGEYTTSMVLLVEEAQPSRRGFVGSFAPFGALGGLLLGSAVGATLMAILPEEDASRWGWRLAFFSGLLIGLVVFLIRRRLPPDKEILATEAARKSPIGEAFRAHWRTILEDRRLLARQWRGLLSLLRLHLHLAEGASARRRLDRAGPKQPRAFLHALPHAARRRAVGPHREEARALPRRGGLCAFRLADLLVHQHAASACDPRGAARLRAVHVLLWRRPRLSGGGLSQACALLGSFDRL